MIRTVYTILFMLLSLQSIAQANTQTRASATIVQPVGATKEADLNFGNFASGSNTGTIVLTKRGVRKSFGGIRLLGTGELAQMASLNILGSNTLVYDIMLPPDVFIKRMEGPDTMLVNAFTVSAKTTRSMENNLAIGATLTVAGAQAAGQYYCSTPFTVLINYN